ncbi:serine/arginine repetitive matrix protein 2 [Streptomyces erythrochromogenes]|uniref:serine/arginine repetitive matrix protein 2 n=1 Tax=Streptomyces erythrochromogenes TaxID=285574 RepID=UPI0036ACBC8F
MAPAQPPSGPRRWDAQAQRWVVDQAPAGPAPGAPPGTAPGTPAPGLPPLPPQPPTAPPAYDPLGPGSQAPPPPYGVPPVPAPPGPRAASGKVAGRWLTPATAGVAVASVAIGAAAVWFLARDTGDADRAGEKNGTVTSGAPTATGGQTPTASGPPTTGAGPTGTPTPGPTGTAAGAGAHETRRDAAGFTIAVPAGWAREEVKEGVFYRSADRAALIQVFRVSEPELSPLDAVKQASTYLRGGTRGYEEIGVGPVPGVPGAAELVYQYDSEESRGVRRGVERVFLAADGTKWAVLTAGPAAEWQVTQDHHAAALAAFRPTG